MEGFVGDAGLGLGIGRHQLSRREWREKRAKIFVREREYRIVEVIRVEHRKRASC